MLWKDKKPKLKLTTTTVRRINVMSGIKDVNLTTNEELSQVGNPHNILENGLTFTACSFFPLQLQLDKFNIPYRHNLRLKQKSFAFHIQKPAWLRRAESSCHLQREQAEPCCRRSSSSVETNPRSVRSFQPVKFNMTAELHAPFSQLLSVNNI